MTAWAALLPLTTGAAVLLTGVSSLALRAVAPTLLRRSEGLAPAAKARALWWACVAPPLLGVGLAGLCFVPSLVPALDHCLREHQGRPHFCMTHLPEAPISPLGWALFGGALAVLGAWVAARGWRTWVELRRLGQLERSARFHAELGAYVLQTPEPLALTGGLWRPRVFLSEGLLAGVDAETLAVVLEHERAHARRRDGFWRAWAAALSLAHAPGVRARLLGALHLADEQACDAESSERLGDRLKVAQALLSVARARPCACAPQREACPGHAGASLGPRIHELLVGERPSTGRWALPWAAAAVAAAVALADPLHHWAEMVLGWILG
jgi:hypothetical protein